MKNTNHILKVFVFLFLQGGFSMAQVNDYLQHNPVWQVNSQCAIPYPCIQNQTYNYYVNGDTLLNSLVYKKIYKSGTGYNWTAQPPPNPCSSNTFSYVDTIPSFYLRSAGKKMFIHVPNNINDTLLYDFDLNVGDTLPLSYNNFLAETWVSGIDSIATPYGFRKRFALSGSGWSQYLVEGIGHSKGLVEPMNVPLECGYDLLCFSLNDTAYYPNSGPTCFLAVGQNQFKQNPTIRITPNPADHNGRILFSDAMKQTSIFLVDLRGQKICLTDDFSGQQFNFDFSSLKNGIYLLMVYQNREIKFTQKIIIAR